MSADENDVRRRAKAVATARRAKARRELGDLLARAVDVAELAGLADVETILVTVALALDGIEEKRIGELATLARKGKTKGHSTRPKTLLLGLEAWFSPEPTDDQLRALIPKLVKLRSLGPFRVLGPSRPDDAERVERELLRVSGRSNREPLEYVRAVLRGLGESAEAANNWTKAIVNERRKRREKERDARKLAASR